MGAKVRGSKNGRVARGQSRLAASSFINRSTPLFLPKTYARARLILGMSTVGFFVVLSAGALMLGLPELWFTTDPQLDPLGLPSLLEALVGLFIIVLCYAGLHLLFDCLGGYVLPRYYDRPYPDAEVFLGQWFQGVVVQALVLMVMGMSLILAARVGGPGMGLVAGTGLVAAAMLILVVLQQWIAVLVGGASRDREVEARFLPGALAYLERYGVPLPPRVRAVRSSDPGFVGGITGLPGRETILLPAQWVANLPADAVGLQLLRRVSIIRSGGRTRGLLLAFSFNIFGFVLAAMLLEADLTGVSGVLTTALGFTIWSFVGLLLLPTLSRPGVFEADRLARDAGPDPALMAKVISDLDQLQDDEPSRGAVVETIFHPIPNVESRLAHLAVPSEVARPSGAWMATRMALYLSWAGLSFLSRAVHCNCGRAQLWVLFPGD